MAAPASAWARPAARVNRRGVALVLAALGLGWHMGAVEWSASAAPPPPGQGYGAYERTVADLPDVRDVLLDDDGVTELSRYNLGTCWPSSWKGWQLDGMGGEAMVEELELQVRSIERVQ